MQIIWNNIIWEIAELCSEVTVTNFINKLQNFCSLSECYIWMQIYPMVSRELTILKFLILQA